MSNIVPFDFGAQVPAQRPQRRPNSINAEAIVSSGASYPSISIKGKVFAIVQDGERRQLTRELDGEQIPVPALNLAVVRANSKYRVFFAKSYTDGDETAKPTCYSFDGQRPDSHVEEPQAANCQVCPHSVWGSKPSTDGTVVKGTACTVRTRLAVVDPKDPKLTEYLLSVPAGSRQNFSEAVKQVDAHGKDYNEVVLRIGFDSEAASPKLTFRPMGLLGDEVFEKIAAKYDSDLVKEIVGVPSVPMVQDVSRPAVQNSVQPKLEKPEPKPRTTLVSEDEIDAALSGTVTVTAAKPDPVKRTRTATKPVDVEDAKPAAKPQISTDEAAAGLLNDLQGLLGSHDD